MNLIRGLRRFLFGLNKEEYLDILKFISVKHRTAIEIASEINMVIQSIYPYLCHLEKIGYINRYSSEEKFISRGNRPKTFYSITNLGLYKCRLKKDD